MVSDLEIAIASPSFASLFLSSKHKTKKKMIQDIILKYLFLLTPKHLGGGSLVVRQMLNLQVGGRLPSRKQVTKTIKELEC